MGMIFALLLLAGSGLLGGLVMLTQDPARDRALRPLAPLFGVAVVAGLIGAVGADLLPWRAVEGTIVERTRRPTGFRSMTTSTLRLVDGRVLTVNGLVYDRCRVGQRYARGALSGMVTCGEERISDPITAQLILSATGGALVGVAVVAGVVAVRRVPTGGA